MDYYDPNNDPQYIQWDDESNAFVAEILPGVRLLVSEEAYNESNAKGLRETDDDRVVYWLGVYLAHGYMGEQERKKSKRVVEEPLEVQPEDLLFDRELNKAKRRMEAALADLRMAVKAYQAYPDAKRERLLRDSIKKVIRDLKQVEDAL